MRYSRVIPIFGSGTRVADLGYFSDWSFVNSGQVSGCFTIYLPYQNSTIDFGSRHYCDYIRYYYDASPSTFAHVFGGCMLFYRNLLFVSKYIDGDSAEHNGLFTPAVGRVYGDLNLVSPVLGSRRYCDDVHSREVSGAEHIHFVVFGGSIGRFAPYDYGFNVRVRAIETFLTKNGIFMLENGYFYADNLHYTVGSRLYIIYLKGVV